MFSKLGDFWNLFRAGEAVSDPAKWKNHQVTATVLGVLILSLVHMLGDFGVILPVDEATATTIAGGIIAIVNVVLTYITTGKIGLLPARQVSGN